MRAEAELFFFINFVLNVVSNVHFGIIYIYVIQCYRSRGLCQTITPDRMEQMVRCPYTHTNLIRSPHLASAQGLCLPVLMQCWATCFSELSVPKVKKLQMEGRGGGHMSDMRSSEIWLERS